MSKEELLEENKELKTENFLLKEEVAQLRKMMFAAKRERFVDNQNPQQGSLFGQDTARETASQHVESEEDSIGTSKKKKKLRKPAKKNVFPASLKRLPIILYPQGVDLEQLTEIGRDVTELLVYKKASVQVKQIIRPRMVDKANETSGVLQAPIPPRIIPRGMVDESLIAEMISEKIQFHTPIHRFSKKLKQCGIKCISENNLYNWFHRAAEALLPIYDLLVGDIIAQPYIQGDETRMPVLSKNKKGAAHRGQMWAFIAPTIKAIAFNYEPTRSAKSACVILEKYQGILQVDGYSAYETVAKTRPIDLIYCMAHCRRKFFEAKDTSPELAKYFLKKVQILYQIEQRCRDENLNFEQRLKIRQQQALPVLEELKSWLTEQANKPDLIPSSRIYKAIKYTYPRWKGLSAYAHDGQLEIDNNWVENTIRPIALGRKNYMFAGSDEAAQNLAILYSLVNTCRKNDINVVNYLHWLLKKVASHKITPQAVNWLPHRIDQKILETFLKEETG